MGILDPRPPLLLRPSARRALMLSRDVLGRPYFDTAIECTYFNWYPHTRRPLLDPCQCGRCQQDREAERKLLERTPTDDH